MASDLVRRVRWRNVGRAVGAVVVVAAVIAWPRLSPPEPRLPDTVDRPLVEPAVEPPPVPSRRRREVARPRVERTKPAEPRMRASRRVPGRHGPRRAAPEATVVARDDGVAAPPADEVAPREDEVPAGRHDEVGPDDGVAPRDDVVRPERLAPPPDPAQREFGFEGR
jgi:hypothetical protein